MKTKGDSQQLPLIVSKPRRHNSTTTLIYNAPRPLNLQAKLLQNLNQIIHIRFLRFKSEGCIICILVDNLLHCARGEVDSFE